MMQQPDEVVEIVFKSPYPNVPEQRLWIALGATVRDAKELLANALGTNGGGGASAAAASASAVRLIFGGRVLFDRDTLATVLSGRDVASPHVFHFVLVGQQQQQQRFQQQQQQQPQPHQRAGDGDNNGEEIGAADVGEQLRRNRRRGGIQIGFLFRLAFFWALLSQGQTPRQAFWMLAFFAALYLAKVGALQWMWAFACALWQQLRPAIAALQPQQQQQRLPAAANETVFGRAQRLWHAMVMPFFLSLSPSWEIPVVVEPRPAADIPNEQAAFAPI